MTLADMVPHGWADDVLTRKAMTDAQSQAGYRMDPAQIVSLAGMSRDYPWMEPAASLSFAQSGLDSYSPVVLSAARLSLGKQLRETRVAKRAVGKPTTQAQADKIKADFLSGGALNGPSIDLGYTVKQGLKGDIPGAFAGPSGSVLPKGASGTGLPLPGGSDTAQLVKPIVRTAGLAAATPLQEAQGFLRAGAEGVSQLAQGNFAQVFDPSSATNTRVPQGIVGGTQSGQAVQALQRGENVDVGAGYLPDINSVTAKRAAAVARQSAPTINGHAFTIGRAAAAGVNELLPGIAEPGSFAFNAISGVTDATIAWRGDPANAVISSLQDARAANKFFAPDVTEANKLASETGLIASTARPEVDGQRVSAFLDSPDVQATAKRWAGMSSGQIWEDSRLGGHPLPIETAQGRPFVASLGAASTPEAMRESLTAAVPSLQPEMIPGGFSYGIRTRVPDSKYFELQGARYLQQPNDPNTFVPQLNRLMMEGSVPKPARLEILSNYIDGMASKPPFMRHAVASEAVGATQDALYESMIAHGTDPVYAKAASTMMGREETQARLYAIDGVTGDERSRVGAIIDGTNHAIPTPELTSEMLNSGIYFPNPRDIRRATSTLAPFFTSKPWSGLLAAPDLFLGLWKPLHVGRPAATVRILADSQIAMAANGYESLASHPFHALAAIVGAAFDRPLAQKLAAGKVVPFAGVEPSRMFDVEGAPIAQFLEPGGALDVRQAAQDNVIMQRLQHAYSDVEKPETVAFGGFFKVSRDNPGAAEALLSDLGRARSDPIVQGLLQQANPAAAKEWLASGEGRQLLDQFAPTATNIDMVNAARVADPADVAAKMIPYGDLTQRVNSDRLVDSLLDGIASRTGSHPDLVAAIREGQIDGIPLWKGRQPNPRAIPSIQAILDTGGGPEWIKAQQTQFLRQGTKDAARGKLDWALNKWMHGLLTVPDKYVSQNPAWSQAYWKHAEKFMPWIEPADYEKLIGNAEDANLPADQLARIKATVLDGTSVDRLKLKDLNYAAKAGSIEEMLKLTHNIGSRSNLGDMLRFFAPFGDAFRLIAQRWAHTLVDNPNVLRRGQQVVGALQQPGSGSVNRALGDTMPANSGFFHKDPQTGEEVFTYPGSEALTDKLLGVPIPLNGGVKGLSLVGDGYPGLGPGVTMPAQWFLPDTPAFDGVRKVIFPFGQPESQGPAQDIATALMPPWLEKITSGPPDQKTFNNTVGYLMNYLASTGDYVLDGPGAREGTAKLAHDAKEKARYFYVIRGAAQSVSPSAPSPTWLVKDKTGHLAILQVVKDQFRKDENAHGPDKALQNLIDSMGPNSVFVPQAFSQSIAFGLPVTAEGQAWARANPDAKAKYPTTYGLFAPQKGKFDITAFENQFTTGERQSLSPEQVIVQAENRVGQWKYFTKRDQIIRDNGGRPLQQAQQRWLDGYQNALQQDLPGYNTSTANPYDSQKRRQSAITELVAAANDPSVTNTDAGQGLVSYLKFRQQAQDQARADGFTTPFQAKAERPLRDWLRGAAQAVIKDHPDFLPTWEQVFQRELTANDAVAGG